LSDMTYLFVAAGREGDALMRVAAPATSECTR
jgi:hypothetical protein